MTNKIIVDGVSSATYQLFFDTLPVFPTAIESVDSVKIPGRNTPLHRHTGEYADLPIPMKAVHVGLDVDHIRAWLSSGKKLELENSPGRYAKIRQVTVHDYKRIGRGALELNITFKIDAFKYESASEPGRLDTFIEFPVKGTKSTYSFESTGSIYSYPVLLISDVKAGATITINGVTVTINEDIETIYFDVENQIVYTTTETDEKILIQNITSGDFWEWKLFPGHNNLIEFDKALTVFLWKNERWL